MHLSNWIKKLCVFFLVLIIFVIDLQYTHTVYAENLCYYNYNTNSNVNYTGKQVIYTYNNRELSLTNPGIIVNGTALADYEELFVKELGLKASRTDNTITISDGKTVLVLTIGSKKVLINGQKQTMSVAPIKLRFDDKIQYYVPTRFVAETFGLNYVWNSTTGIAKLTKTLLLTINQKTVLYNNTFYKASNIEQNISSNMPIIFYNNCILAPAKAIFEALGCQYQEEESKISIAKDDIAIRMELNSNSALVNEHSFTMEEEPIAITNQKTQETLVYVPMEFVATMLGYQINYTDSQHNFVFQETEYTGNDELHPELKKFTQTTKKETEEEQKPLKYYFEWETAEASVENMEEQKNISKIVAYALENADVLEIYGITRDDIKDFIDSHALVFEFESVTSDLGTQFFVDFNTPHLNYALLTTIYKNTKMFFMIPYDNQWQFVEKEDCVQVFFMDADLSLDDLKITSEEAPEPVEVIEEPVTPYPENQLVIPLPDMINFEEIQIQDNYLKNNFKIYIPGNQCSFYEQNEFINPYDFVTDIELIYDETTNNTLITCNTTHICGYTYEIEDNYMAFTVGKPSEIFNKIVVLDAGHGGKDPGASRNNIDEKDINFSILYTYAKGLFENSDIKVYYTRETDKFVSLNDRAKLSREIGADLFISLHVNASEFETAKGTEVFYSKSNNISLASGLNSYKLAKCLATNVSTAFNSKLRGVTKSDYYVVHYNSVPAVLIELGFISNSSERSKLANKTYQKKVAEAIYQSVIEIFSAYPTGR